MIRPVVGEMVREMSLRKVLVLEEKRREVWMEKVPDGGDGVDFMTMVVC